MWNVAKYGTYASLILRRANTKFIDYIVLVKIAVTYAEFMRKFRLLVECLTL